MGRASAVLPAWSSAVNGARAGTQSDELATPSGMVRPAHRGTLFSDRKRAANSSASSPRFERDDSTPFKPIQKRNLVIQQTTEDLLQGSKILRSSAKHGHHVVHETLEEIGEDVAILSPSMKQQRRSTFRKRLSQSNLDRFNAHVQRKESTRRKAYGHIGLLKVTTFFLLVFVCFASISVYSGYAINKQTGPAWKRLGIPMEELEKTMLLDRVDLSELVKNFIFLDADGARAVVNDLTKINCVVFSIVVQVTTILVQVGAREFSANSILLFVSDRRLVVATLFYSMTLCYMIVLTNVTSDTYIPRGEILLASTFTLLGILSLIPYFLYLSRMLNPLKLVKRVAESGLRACTYSDQKDYHLDDPKTLVAIERDRDQAIWAVENICQFGINAMKNQRSQIAYTCVEVLSHFLIGYGVNKDFWSDRWFDVTPELRDTPDFFALSLEGISDLEKRRCWLEWKVLRQFQRMYGESLEIMRDVTYVLAVNTRRIAEACAARHDYHAFEYCVRFFNTFIRQGIAKRDTVTVHNVLHQYRQLCASVLSNDEELVKLIAQRKRKAVNEGVEFFQVDDLIQISGNYVVEEARDIIIAMEKKIISMGQYLVYYSSVALQNNVFYVSETIAHELALICQEAFLNKRECHQELLLTFLMLHEAPQEKNLKSVTWGVRGAQIKLATFYACNGGQEFFVCIQKTFQNSNKDDLVSCWRRLERVHDREFWEVSDRGINIEYLSPAQKSKLSQFFQGLGVSFDDLNANAYLFYDEDFFRAIAEEIPTLPDDETSDLASEAGAGRSQPPACGHAIPGSGNKEDFVSSDPAIYGLAQATSRPRRSSIHEMLLHGKSPAQIEFEAVRMAMKSLNGYRDSHNKVEIPDETLENAENLAGYEAAKEDGEPRDPAPA